MENGSTFMGYPSTFASVVENQTAAQPQYAETPSPEAYLVPVVFAAIFGIGVAGNGTLIYTVFRHKSMRNTPNIFLVSLAAGDLLLIIVSVPFTSTIYTFHQWPYGLVICKLNEFLQALSLGVSVFTLTALGAERYVAIAYPMKHTNPSMVRTLLAVGAIWCVSAILASLEAVAARIQHHDYGVIKLVICDIHPPEWGDAYKKFHAMYRFLVYFTLPIIVIATFYLLMARILLLSSSRLPAEGRTQGQAFRQMETRKKVAKVVLSFVAIFIVCWLPRHTYLLWFHFDPGLYNMFWHVFKIVGFCLSFINSCVNPFTLYILSSRFRHYYNRYLFCCCTHKRSYRRPRKTSHSAMCTFDSVSRGVNSHCTSTAYEMN